MQVINTNLRYRNNLIPLNLAKVGLVFLHHITATTATPQQIHQWHLDNGWNGFGYNEYIKKDGTVYIGRGDHIGAHVHGYNSKSYGIAVEGNYEVEKDMPQAQFNSLIDRIKHHKHRLPKGDLIKVLPHDTFSKTACPGKHFPMLQIYESLARRERDKNEHEELFKFLEGFNEPTEHIASLYRIKQILENCFKADEITNQRLKEMVKNNQISDETAKLVYAITRGQLRDVLRR